MSESYQPPKVDHHAHSAALDADGPGGGEDDYVPAPREKKKELDFDITPMIDVVFLLLIFFMVSSTMQEPAPADAPPARNGEGLEAAHAVRLALLPEKAGVVEVELPDGRAVPLTEAVDRGLILEAVEAARETVPPKNRDHPAGRPRRRRRATCGKS